MEEEQIKAIRKEFYEFFQNGYDFEFFLKEFLKDLGFTDIKVTQKSRDGGVDLICYKDIIEKLETVKSEKFMVQAKKYKQSVPPREIRALNGVYQGTRKIFITTSDFSQGIRKEIQEQNMDMTLISGKDIIQFYMQDKSDKMFDWEPRFSKEKLEELINKNKDDSQKENKINNEAKQEKILRVISKNDIRARILRIPNEIYEQIGNVKFYPVVIDGLEKKLNIIHEIKSFAGITEFYKVHHYIQEERINKNSYWYLDEKDKKIYIELED